MKKVFNQELSYIKNERHIKTANVLLDLIPSYFYEIAASSTGKYHPSFALGSGGLVRHTKVAVRIAYELLYNDTIGRVFTENDKDLIILSLIFHDSLKEGLAKNTHTVFDHPLIASNFIKEQKEKLFLNDGELKIVIGMIESHTGEWNTNGYSNVILPLPNNKYERFVHMCDFLASRKFLDIKFEENEIV